jgi:VWFA-related protein
MKHWSLSMAWLATGALVCLPAFSQQPAASASAQQSPTARATAEEVLLDIIVRDKKGKPVTDLKPEELTITDSGAAQTLTSFRIIRGSEAISPTGAATTLDPLRQIRLVTLAFEPMDEVDQRKLTRLAAIDLVKGEQGANVYYSVVVISNRLLAVQPFTNDKQALVHAIERATGGFGGPRLATESASILGELRSSLGGSVGSGASQTAGPPPPGTDFTAPILARVMLDMLRMEAAAASQGARLSISALKALVQGLQPMPGRKSVIYFTLGLPVTPELDVPFRNLMSLANRANVTFYSVDTHGGRTFAGSGDARIKAGSYTTSEATRAGENADAAEQLRQAAAASNATTGLSGADTGGSSIGRSTPGAVTKEEIMAADTAETSGRLNTRLPVRDLAESTGGFLIGDSNDLRGPLRKVNEEISSYYELTFDPHIQNYDGSFHKLAVGAGRKDLVIHARNGYFALPPEARALGLETFEVPLLKAVSGGKISDDVKFRAGAVLLQPRDDGTDLSVLVEVPLHGLQAETDAAKKTLNVHCSLAALVKDAKGEVVQKLSRDRSFQVTADQLKMGNFVDKKMVELPPGKYTLESAVMDRESGKIGTARSDFTIAAKGKGVGISSLMLVRSFAPNAKGLDPDEPFQFQGASITPTLDTSVHKVPDAALRLFFVVYRDPSIAAKPTVEIEFLQNGKSLTKAHLPLPEADAQGRIPYVMTVPAASIPPGLYEVRATARQGDTSSETSIPVQIDAM